MCYCFREKNNELPPLKDILIAYFIGILYGWKSYRIQRDTGDMLGDSCCGILQIALKKASGFGKPHICARCEPFSFGLTLSAVVFWGLAAHPQEGLLDPPSRPLEIQPLFHWSSPLTTVFCLPLITLTCPLSSNKLLVSLSLSKETICFIHWAPRAGESGW